MEMSRLTRDGTAEPISRDQILRHEREQGNIHFSCSADHVQDWQPYPVDPYSCYMCDHTYIQDVIFDRVGIAQPHEGSWPAAPYRTVPFRIMQTYKSTQHKKI